jgi:phosphate starvation-inducible protein PhoH and related proteins
MVTLTSTCYDSYTAQGGYFLSESFTIVLEDSHLLRDICGPQDENLKGIETLLGGRVVARGNEIILETENRDSRDLFGILIGKMKEHRKAGQTLTPQLIESLFSSLLENGEKKTDLLSELHIAIPSSLKIFPRNYNQAQYIDSMYARDIVFGIGPAGTGKTFLAVAHALKEILERKKKRLILTRPVVEAGESLGFLPGDLSQKISPYLRPLYDAIDRLIPFNILNKLEESRIIEVAPLAYMRGRSLSDSYIILDEAQNSTREQMKMFLTRIGENSKAIITGDITQIDLPKKSQSGLIHAKTVLSEIDEIDFCYFNSGDVVRNRLVRRIVDAYESQEKKAP